ncbi:MAG: S1C family serine protease [Anaerolineae bacterium]
MENRTQPPLSGWQVAVIAIAALLLAWLCCGAGLVVGGIAGFGLGRASIRPEWRITPIPERPTPFAPPSERPYLGIRYIMRTRGAEITEVVPDSPADKAGLQVGDIILKVDDQRVRSSRPLTDILLSYRPGDRVILTVERKGKETEIPVTLGRWPSP